jgi:hypothetical protein
MGAGHTLTFSIVGKGQTAGHNKNSSAKGFKNINCVCFSVGVNSRVNHAA